jgi:flagellar hook-basal body complex protein FliE
MALNIGSLSAALAPNSAAQLAALVRTNAMHYTSAGAQNDPATDRLEGISAGAAQAPSFENAFLKALDGVSASQGKGDSLLQQIVADPDSVDAQDVTIAMAEANMSLNLAKTILSRVVTAWKDVINTR